MKRALLGLLAAALVIGAIALALVPTAGKQYRLWREARAAEEYRDAADALDTLACGERMAQARAANAELTEIALRDAWDESDSPGDDAGAAVLDIAGNGVIAVLELPKLGLILPVYRDNTPGALARSVAHLEGTSLPVGGDGAHCVLAGQGDGRLSSPIDGLERLIPGDLFTLHTLRQTLTYEVEDLEISAPQALEPQAVDGEADVCTLMTAVTLDGEDARLWVRAKRVRRRSIPLEDDTQVLPGWAARLILAAPLALAGWLALALVEGLRRAADRRKRKRMKL